MRRRRQKKKSGNGNITLFPSPPRAIPGDPGLPLVGHTFGFMHDPVRFLGERYRRYGEISWSNAFGIRMVSMPAEKPVRDVPAAAPAEGEGKA